MNLQTVFDEAYRQTDGDQSRAPCVSLIEALAERGAISAALRYGEKPLVIYTIGALSEYETEVISLDAERHGLITATRSQRRRIAREICHRLPLDAPLEAIRTAFQDARQQSPTADDERSCHVQYFEALAQRGALSAALDMHRLVALPRSPSRCRLPIPYPATLPRATSGANPCRANVRIANDRGAIGKHNGVERSA